MSECSGTNQTLTVTADSRGSTMVEYCVLLGFIGIIVASAIATLGFPLLKLYRFMQLVIVAPVT